MPATAPIPSLACSQPCGYFLSSSSSAAAGSSPWRQGTERREWTPKRSNSRPSAGCGSALGLSPVPSSGWGKARLGDGSGPGAEEDSGRDAARRLVQGRSRRERGRGCGLGGGSVPGSDGAHRRLGVWPRSVTNDGNDAGSPETIISAAFRPRPAGATRCQPGAGLGQRQAQGGSRPIASSSPVQRIGLGGGAGVSARVRPPTEKSWVRWDG